MTNISLLSEAIEKSGLKSSFICEKLGITLSGFSKKRRNKLFFNASEIMILQKLLNLSNEERDAIFFDEDVDKSST